MAEYNECIGRTRASKLSRAGHVPTKYLYLPPAPLFGIEVYHKSSSLLLLKTLGDKLIVLCPWICEQISHNQTGKIKQWPWIED